MKLHQLRYLAAVAQSGLNPNAAAAQKLRATSADEGQQADQAWHEDELGFQIFTREGRQSRITPAGQQVLDQALQILKETQAIRDLATELARDGEPRTALPSAPRIRRRATCCRK